MAYSSSRRFKNNYYKFALVIASISILTVCIFVWIHFRASSPIPSTIKKQLTFVPFLTNNISADLKPENVKYDNSIKLLSYSVDYSGTKVVVSQQASPESFSDVPLAYDALMTKMHSKDTFDTASGKVNITYPDELKGLQAAVMNSKGTLLFAKPSKNISTDNWKKFFNGLNLDR